jgi:hypothetical protein
MVRRYGGAAKGLTEQPDEWDVLSAMLLQWGGIHGQCAFNQE